MRKWKSSMLDMQDNVESLSDLSEHETSPTTIMQETDDDIVEITGVSETSQRSKKTKSV